MKLTQGKNDFFESLGSIGLSHHDISILTSTRDYQVKIFELIKSAKKRIYITALYLQDDEAGDAVLKALFEAKQNNPDLEVKVVVDFLRAQRGLMGQEACVGNVGLYRKLSQQYQYPIEIHGVPIKSREFLGVLHLKGLVFDDCVLYSGASINNVYLHYLDLYRYDRYHIIHSGALADTFVHFIEHNLVNSGAAKSLMTDSIVQVKQLKTAIRRQKRILRKAEYELQSDAQVEDDNDLILIPLTGFGQHKNKLNKAIYQLIKQTAKEVVIFTPYFNFPEKIRKALKSLLKQDKKVTIVVGDKKANDFFIPEHESFSKTGVLPYIYESNLKRFVKSHQKFIDTGLLAVHLWRNGRNSFHLKGINSDQTNYLITGHNINPRAWRLDLENGILIRDPQQFLQEKFDDELLQVMKNCRKINHFDDLENPDDYPYKVKKLLKKLKRVRLDRIINQLL